MLLMFDSTVKEELKIFSKQREREVDLNYYKPPGAVSEAKMMVSLRRQVLKVQRRDRGQAVAELLYLMVCSRFKHLNVPLLTPLRLASDSELTSEADDRLWGLTDIYSVEALETVRDHLLRTFANAKTASVGNFNKG